MSAIDSNTLEVLIREVKVWKNRSWHKTDTGYAMDFDHKYNISLKTEGPVPVLIMGLKGTRPQWERATDLDSWAFNSAGAPQFWIATLLDAVSNGEIPVRDTAEKTVDFMIELDRKSQGDMARYNLLREDVRLGRYVP